MNPYRKFLPLVFPLLLSASCERMHGDESFTIAEFDTGRLVLSASPPFGFGRHDVTFYFEGSHGRDFLARTKLSNDGANLGNHNVEVTLQPDGSWLVILKGQEQADKFWRLKTAGAGATMKKLPSNPNG